MNTLSLQIPLFNISIARNFIWALGIPSLLIGTLDRGAAILADNYVSPIEFTQVCIAAFLLISWVYLKPFDEKEYEVLRETFSSRQRLAASKDENHLLVAQKRMSELQDQHIISQAYVLPYPYLCQIYHLLNIKHLETIHSFSLGDLRIVNVNSCAPTSLGGRVRFSTVLNSPLSLIKAWRQPIVEVELTLHTRYMVELSIPVYGGKKITVIFNSFPINSDTHELLIDIYTDLKWPKPILQIILHIASVFTLFEDLPYLKQLSSKNLTQLFSRNRTSKHEMMWLFRRFVELYTPEQEVKSSENSL